MSDDDDLLDWIDEDESARDMQELTAASLEPPVNTDEITLTPGPRLDMITAKLAAEFAAELITATEIIEQYNITPDQMRVIGKSKAFRELYADAKLAMGGGLETTQRGRLKADMVIEDGLLTMHNIIRDPGSSPANAADAFRAVTSISSHAAKNRPAGSADDADGVKGFVLNITLSGESKPTTIEGKILDGDKGTTALPES